MRIITAMILFLTLSLVGIGVYSPVSAAGMQDIILVNGGDNSANANTNISVKDNFLKGIQTYMIGLLGIVSVSVFLYVGYTLFTAQGNPDEFKKAWKSLTYVVIGLAVIPLSFIVVKIITGFTVK